MFSVPTSREICVLQNTNGFRSNGLNRFCSHLGYCGFIFPHCSRESYVMGKDNRYRIFCGYIVLRSSMSNKMVFGISYICLSGWRPSLYRMHGALQPQKPCTDFNQIWNVDLLESYLWTLHCLTRYFGIADISKNKNINNSVSKSTCFFINFCLDAATRTQTKRISSPPLQKCRFVLPIWDGKKSAFGPL